MKEKIYTIPVTESFEQESECPFCYLEEKLEREAVEYALGAAMMEPDFRIVSNEKGYCRRHFTQMINSPNKLSLALVLDTHLKEIIEKLEKQKKSAPQKKGGMFSKQKPEEKIISDCADLSGKCVVCDKINETMERYFDVFYYMLENDEAFKVRVLNSKGFCLRHFPKMVEGAYKNMKQPQEFISKIYENEIENLKRINADVHKFTLKFDYRNRDMELGEAADAPQRAVQKLRGYIAEEFKK